MSSAIEAISSLVVGVVDSVSPDEIRVILDIDAPQTVALNSGSPTAFPRVNGYVLIPNEGGAVVGLVVFLGVERSPFPRRTGLKDFGLVDLPFPLRKLHVTPLGMLRRRSRSNSEEGEHRYELERGVATFPSIGDSVFLPTQEQLRSIIEAEGEDRRVLIGVSPLAANAQVYVDPDKLFGRHLAILGNTGSGKSCSVAGIIRWCLDAAANAKKAEGAVNARFIVLDPNGEYLDTFSEFQPRIFKISPEADSARQLRVPAWMWSSLEWSAFAQASPRIQRPLLLEALRLIRSGSSIETSAESRISRVLGGRSSYLKTLLEKGPESYSLFPKNKDVMTILDHIINETKIYEDNVGGDVRSLLENVRDVCNSVIARSTYAYGNDRRVNPLGELDLSEPLQAIQNLLSALPHSVLGSTESEDSPVPFEVETFPEFLGAVAALEVSGNEQYTANLTWRIKSLLADSRLREIIGSEPAVSLADWLSQVIGSDGSDGQISVIDLSLVPSEIVHVVIAVLARLVFEAIQRYRRLNGVELPTVLVLEEAHNFIRRSRGRDEDESEILTPAQMCRMTFERISREGRKFGLGLLLASQRPYELSATVLAQCNTFLLHRLVNDQDQELVQRLVPDNVRGILRELPSLPAGQAILLGWATAVPILVQMNHLPKKHRPHSNDPDFWRVWTREDERVIDWERVAEDWTS